MQVFSPLAGSKVLRNQAINIYIYIYQLNPYAVCQTCDTACQLCHQSKYSKVTDYDNTSDAETCGLHCHDLLTAALTGSIVATWCLAAYTALQPSKGVE